MICDRRVLGAVGAAALMLFHCSAVAQKPAPTAPTEAQPASEYQTRRAAALADALGVGGWPQRPELYVTPPVGKALLSKPDRVAPEVRACTTVELGDEKWPQCTWSWQGLNAEYKPARADWLDLQITLTPGSRAAQDYLVGSLADSQLPTEAVVARYKAAERPANLGDVAFLVHSRKANETSISFARANVVLRIRAHGALSAEALPLAHRLDESLASQAPLTEKELRSLSNK